MWRARLWQAQQWNARIWGANVAEVGPGNPSVGSWVLTEVGRWFLTKALPEYRGADLWVPWQTTELYRAFLLAVTEYDGGAPYPEGLSNEWAQRFLDYLIVNGG